MSAANGLKFEEDKDYISKHTSNILFYSIYVQKTNCLQSRPQYSSTAVQTQRQKTTHSSYEGINLSITIRRNINVLLIIFQNINVSLIIIY